MGQAKWWGWGDEGVSFTHADKPGLAPFLERALGLDVRGTTSRPAAFDDLDIPESTLSPALRSELEAATGSAHVSTDALDRVVHARGKSLRDLVRHRRGDVGRLPDVVVRPADEDELAAVVRAAIDADAVVIPFGGGTNISGSLEAPADEERDIVSVDLGRMDQVLAIDDAARLARVQPGAFGPHLEEQLNARGWTVGHFPDSFSYSTLGGWIATRSSGMQSDKYGDIADLTRAVRVVTPAGVLATRAGAARVDGPERARDGAGQRGAPRDHQRGDGPRPSRARAARDPRLPLPRLAQRPGRDARHRRQRGVTVGHARVRRERDAVLLRHPEGPVADRSGQVQGPDDVPGAAPQLRPRGHVPVVHRLRGHQGPRHRAAQARRRRSSSATAA